MAILPPDPIYLFRGESDPVHSLCFKVSPYVEQLYTGTESGQICIWDLKKKRRISKLSTRKEPCLSLRIDNDERLVAQRKGGSFDVWSADGSEWRLDKTMETSYCGFCRFKPLGEDLLLVPLSSSKVGALSLKTQDIVYELEHPTVDDKLSVGGIMTINIIDCFENPHVLVGYETGDLGLWDLRERRVLSWLKTDDCPIAVNFDNYWMRGIVGSPSDKLEVFEISRSQVMSRKSSVSVKNAGISVVASRPDAKVFATGGWDGRLRIFSWKTLRPLVVLDQHRGTIHDIAYSNGKIDAYSSKGVMAASGKDGAISLWDIYNQ